MMAGQPATIADRVHDALYTEVLLLADETYAWFNMEARGVGATLPPGRRVQLACEGLNATTRLLHMIALLGTRRLRSGQPPAALPPDSAIDADLLALLPAEARRMIVAGQELYARLHRIEARPGEAGPARAPMRLRRAG